MNSQQFNQKYSLSPKMNQFLKRKINDAEFKTTIAGEPKKMWKETIKRFFTNPISIIAIIIFITLILMGIIISWTSPFKPKQAIDSGDINIIRYLPPAYQKYTYIPLTHSEKLTNNVIAKIEQWKQELDNPSFKDYYNYFISLTEYQEKALNSNQDLITYNHINFFKLSKVWQQFIENKKNGVILSLDEIKQLVNQVEWKTSILGTDDIGADIWTTAWYSTWNSIKIALIVATIETIIGVAIGAYLGYHAGKWVDTIMMRLIDIFLSPPSLVWLLLFVTIFGSTDTALIIALIFVGWAGPVSRTRMFMITVKNEEYITASKSVGAKKVRLIFVHALPAILGKIATSYVRTIPAIIMSIASLSFLGFFKSENSTNLGQILIDANATASKNIWTLALPCIILLSLSLSLHFISLGVHDSLDPRVMTSKR